jgi:hypothetical protein
VAGDQPVSGRHERARSGPKWAQRSTRRPTRSHGCESATNSGTESYRVCRSAHPETHRHAIVSQGFTDRDVEVGKVPSLPPRQRRAHRGSAIPAMSVSPPATFTEYSFHGILPVVAWEVEGTDRFADWFADLSEEEQVDVGSVVDLLVEHGPALPFPYSSGIHGSRHRHMRELRIQHAGRPYRVLYASIRVVPRSCCSAATRRGTIVGTKCMCRWPICCTTSTSRH